MSEDYLKVAFEGMIKSAKQDIDRQKEEMSGQITSMVDEVKQFVEVRKQEIAELLAEVREIKLPPMVKIEGGLEQELAHNQLPDLIKIMCASRRNKKTIMMVGAAGAGKSKMVSQASRVFKLDFYPMSIGAQTTKSDLMGFMNAQGDYTSSPVRMAFENGGVLLLDEIDAGNSGTLTILNNLLSNDEIMFPDKRVQKHKDFICVCTANTYGKGGTMEYVGRNRLDAATLDRFVVMNIKYDTELEKYLCKNDWYWSIIQQMRENADRYDIKIIISPRAAIEGADLLDAGFKIKDVLDMCVFKGASNDVKSKIMEGIDLKKKKEVKE